MFPSGEKESPNSEEVRVIDQKKREAVGVVFVASVSAGM